MFDRKDRRPTKELVGSLQLAVVALRRRRADLELSTRGPFDTARSLALDGVLIVLETLESLTKVEAADPPRAESARW